MSLGQERAASFQFPASRRHHKCSCILSDPEKITSSNSKQTVRNADTGRSAYCTTMRDHTQIMSHRSCCSRWYSDLLCDGWCGDWILVGGEIFCVIQTDPEAHPASCTMGTVSSLSVKWLQHGTDCSPPSSARLQMHWSFTSASPLHVNAYFGMTFVCMESLKLLQGKTNSEMWADLLAERSVLYLPRQFEVHL
jgi:hypothetical protein